MAGRTLAVRCAKALASGSIFLLFWALATLCAWIVFPILDLAWRRRPRLERVARFQRIAGNGFAAVLHAMRWVRIQDFDPATARLVPPPGPFVLIANHPTFTDVVALGAICPNLCYIVKPFYFHNPLAFLVVGPLLRYLGHIESAAAGSPMAGAAVIAEAVARLRDGLPVLVFPEGTRSPAGAIGPIARGAFDIAQRAGVPVVPVCVTCDPPLLGRGMAWYDIPAATVHYDLTALPPSGMERWGGDSAAAAAHFQRVFAAHVASTARAAARPLAGVEMTLE